MIKKTTRPVLVTGTALLALLMIVSFSGCFGALAQLVYVVKGHAVPAAYDGLKEKRVAVICVSDASAYGPDRLTYTVSKAVGMKLSQGVKKIDVVPHQEIESWVDQNGWNELDYTKLGKGVKAQQVVAIEIASYSIREGQTLFKGRADMTVTVYDLENQSGSRVAYSFGPELFEFPKNGRPSIQTNDRQFESFFLARLTQHISNHFVTHDKLESFADEAMMDPR